MVRNVLMSKVRTIKTVDRNRLPMDAEGAVKALEFGAYGTFAAGGLAALVAANTAPLLLIAAVPVVGAATGSVWGYVSGRRNGIKKKQRAPESSN